MRDLRKADAGDFDEAKRLAQERLSKGQDKDKK